MSDGRRKGPRHVSGVDTGRPAPAPPGRNSLRCKHVPPYSQQATTGIGRSRPRRSATPSISKCSLSEAVTEPRQPRPRRAPADWRRSAGPAPRPPPPAAPPSSGRHMRNYSRAGRVAAARTQSGPSRRRPRTPPAPRRRSGRPAGPEAARSCQTPRLARGACLAGGDAC